MSVIEEVRREREDLARVLKKHTGIRKIVEDLYPDSAHFIYELLQNAEDTGATEAQFTLSKTGLVFEHNGRPFEPKDIYAITDIGEGTKANDDDKIGRFGVGFKAVFAYSETPHIWSPSFSFKITDLVLPSALEPKTALGNKTRFEFPFNNPKKIASTAYDEVNVGLKELAETTLLFLSHLELICWQNATGQSGAILRDKHTENHFEVLKQTNGKTTVSSHFLKFDQPVAGLEKQRVAVAYALDFLPNVQDFDPKKALEKQLKIIPATPGRVAVFFPAKSEKSGLRFHLHAPFVPELSRASIKDADANLPLFQQLATLAAESLHQIRDLGLLTVDFLAVLPNPRDEISKLYLGIREAIVDEMNEQPLTPTYAKTHAPAKYLHQAKISLKELLSNNNDIAFLVNYDDEPPQWASVCALQGTNIERFMTGLAITDWDIEQFVDLLSEKASVGGRSIPYSPYYTTEPDAEFMTWLSGKSVDWHQEFYALLYADYLSSTGWQKDSRINNLKKLRIIRLTNNEYSIGPKSFFPSDGIEQDDDLPRVDAKVYMSGKKKGQQESAKKFLEEIGVREVGEAEQIEAILKQRYTKTNLQPLKKDLARFIALLEKEPDKKNLFTSCFIFERSDGKWSPPSQIFLDHPFMDTGLSAYYDALGESATRFSLADSYKDCGVSSKRLAKFAEAVGVQTELKVTQTKCKNNPQWEKDLKSAPGSVWTWTGVDRDYEIVGLEKIFDGTTFENLPLEPSLVISRLIWKRMYSLPPYPDCLSATFSYNQSNSARYAASILIHQLRKFPWVPQVYGVDSVDFVRPTDAVQRLLPQNQGFQFDPGWEWLKAIQFGDEAVKKSQVYQQKQSHAQSAGFESAEELDKFKQARDAGFNPDEWLAQNAQRQRISQPEDSVPDPALRQKMILANTADAPNKESVLLERSIQKGTSDVTTDAKAYLRTKYTNADRQLICQCCQEEMPFKLRSGEYYFEVVQCISDEEKRHFQNRLALCPTCAAMYQYARETDDAEIRRSIVEHEADEKTPAVEIPVRLAGRELTLRFVGKHWFDLKTVLSQ